MQKKILGMAVAAALAAPALALAQSSVQVYGTVHLSVNQMKISGDTAGLLNGDTKYGVASHASNWGLRSTESLGGGMTAWFQAEFNMQMARNNGVNDGENTARNSGVGLRGSWGNIYLGNWETPWAQTFRFWDVGSIGGWGPVTSIIGRRETTGSAPSRNCSNLQSGAGSGPAGGGTPNAPTAAGLATPTNICGQDAETANGGTAVGAYALWRRFSNAVHYETPVWSGFQGKLAIMPNERKSNYVVAAANTAAGNPATASRAAQFNENPSAWSASVGWTGMGGRARAFIATMQAKDFSTVAQTDGGWTIGGGYNFGPAELGGVYEKYTYKLAAGDSTAKEWALALAVPVGPGKIGASYAKASALSGSAAPAQAANDTAAKMWNLGYQWDLSKRTNLGFGVAKIDNGRDIAFTWTGQIPTQNGFSSGAVATGQDQTNFFISMRHSF